MPKRISKMARLIAKDIEWINEHQFEDDLYKPQPKQNLKQAEAVRQFYCKIDKHRAALKRAGVSILPRRQTLRSGKSQLVKLAAMAALFNTNSVW